LVNELCGEVDDKEEEGSEDGDGDDIDRLKSFMDCKDDKTGDEK